MKGIMLGVLAAGALSFTVMAEEAASPAAPADKGPKDGKMFEAMDTDGNGTLSLDEFKAAMTKKFEARKPKDGEAAKPMPNFDEMFTKMDADKSGGLSKEEMASAHKGGPRDGARKGEGRKGNGEGHKKAQQ